MMCTKANIDTEIAAKNRQCQDYRRLNVIKRLKIVARLAAAKPCNAGMLLRLHAPQVRRRSI